MSRFWFMSKEFERALFVFVQPSFPSAFTILCGLKRFFLPRKTPCEPKNPIFSVTQREVKLWMTIFRAYCVRRQGLSSRFGILSFFSDRFRTSRRQRALKFLCFLNVFRGLVWTLERSKGVQPLSLSSLFDICASWGRAQEFSVQGLRASKGSFLSNGTLGFLKKSVI